MVNRELLKRDGFSEVEIDKIDFYCTAQHEAGKLDSTATPIIMNGELMLVCATVAEAITLVRRQAEQSHFDKR